MTTARLAGKTAIITGAGSGIGRACALRFAEEGAVVGVSSLLPEECKAVVAEIESAGGQAIALPCDVKKAGKLAAMIEQAHDDWGHIDILMNNAGGATPGPWIEQDEDEFRHLMQLNMESVHYGIKAVLPLMLEQGGGCIISVSSGAGINATAGLITYGAAKAGLTHLTRGIAVEYGSQGIRANVVAPGPMDTPGMRSWLDSLGDDAHNKFAAQVPSGRLGTGEDIAAAALFLATDEASFVNGVVLPVDGAISAVLSQPQL
jgi:NAD(P)-dependent dehydrogenase (short-subunit alcohol dehydrogenase family)